MRIIDAFWEKRNLGVTCYEIELEQTDSIESVSYKLDNLIERQYMVVKIPSARWDLIPVFQSRGYYFIETTIALETNFKKMGYKLPDIPQRLKKICSHCSWELMNNTDLEEFRGEIKKNIFKTDRIYIDPVFGEKQSAQRYNLWVNDLIKQGNIPYKVLLNQKNIGFCLDKEISPNVYLGILGGIYTEYENTGIGYLYDYASFMLNLERKAEKCIFTISGNNPAILKLHTTFGAVVKGLTYVFVKHNR